MSALVAGACWALAACTTDPPVRPHGSVDAGIVEHPDAGPGTVRPNALDTTYASGGYVTRGTPANVDVRDVLVLPDGAVLVAGGLEVAAEPGRWGAFVAKLTPAGVLDASFGSGGLVEDTPAGTSIALSVVRLANGFLRVAVETGAAHPTLTILGLDASGAHDPLFGTAGRLAVEGLALSFLEREPMALDLGSRLLVAGVQSGGDQLAVKRLDANDGHLDTGFGTAGTAATTFELRVKHLAVGSDGNIYVGGHDPSGRHVDVVRFSAAGALDVGYGVSGRYSAPIAPGGSSSLDAIAVDAAHRVVILAGLGSTALTLARLDGGGALDTTFGTGGSVDVVPPADVLTSRGARLALTTDGRIAVSCLYAIAAERISAQAVLVFSATGALDATSGIGGARAGLVPGYTVSPGDFGLGLDGKVYIAGAAQSQASDGARALLLERLIIQ